MTDKFPMHNEFPMDEAYKAKAAERGFAGDKALWLFEEWRQYWTGRPGEDKTPRGWLQCWDNNLKRKARNGVTNGKGGRFERKPTTETVAPGPRMIWVGGRGYGFLDILPLKHKQASGQRLTLTNGWRWRNGMGERPDLDAIEIRQDVLKAPHWFLAWPWEKAPKCTSSDVRDLLTYCRELEAENKRLREETEILEFHLEQRAGKIEPQPPKT